MLAPKSIPHRASLRGPLVTDLRLWERPSRIFSEVNALLFCELHAPLQADVSPTTGRYPSSTWKPLWRTSAPTTFMLCWLLVALR